MATRAPTVETTKESSSCRPGRSDLASRLRPAQGDGRTANPSATAGPTVRREGGRNLTRLGAPIPQRVPFTGQTMSGTPPAWWHSSPSRVRVGIAEGLPPDSDEHDCESAATHLLTCASRCAFPSPEQWRLPRSPAAQHEAQRGAVRRCRTHRRSCPVRNDSKRPSPGKVVVTA